MRKAWIALIAGSLAVSAAACGEDKKPSAQDFQASGFPSSPPSVSAPFEVGTVTIDGKVLNDHGSVDVTGKTTFPIQMGDMFFAPTVLKGTPGQKIKLELHNPGPSTHNFSIDEPGLKLSQDVAVGGDRSVSVTFPESGSIVFFCKYHQDQGMRGALQVG